MYLYHVDKTKLTCNHRQKMDLPGHLEGKSWER